MFEKGREGCSYGTGRGPANLASYAALTTPEIHKLYGFFSNSAKEEFDPLKYTGKEVAMAGDSLLPTSRNDSEAGRVQAEAEEGSGGGNKYLAQVVVVGRHVVGFGIESGKWVWLKIREAASRVMSA